MFDFFKKRKLSLESKAEDSNKNKQSSSTAEIGAGIAATSIAHDKISEAAQTFSKPETYTGNRNLYDSGSAKVRAKKILFQSGEPVIDPYTGERLVLTKKEAKLLYGQDWTKHLAETDHVKPLEEIFYDTRDNVWLTTDDIRDVANSDENLSVASRHFNNPKRSRTNEEYVTDSDYLDKKGIHLSEEGKNRALEDGEFAEKSIDKKLKSVSLENALKTGHDAGLDSAIYAGGNSLTISGIMNIVSVLKGEKRAEEAIEETLKTGAKAAVTGYAMGGGLTVVSHQLSNSKSEFLKGLVKSNVPGKVITTIMVTGTTLKKWGEGEITTQECLIELGNKGLNVATMGYSMAVGQAVIPIPILGGAIGALVGSALTSSYYNNLIRSLQMKEIEHQERMRVIKECKQVAEQTKAFRKELEAYLSSYLKEYKDCFNSAISNMKFAYEAGDAESMIISANEITKKLGGKTHYETVEEFKVFLDSDTVDIL